MTARYFPSFSEKIPASGACVEPLDILDKLRSGHKRILDSVDVSCSCFRLVSDLLNALGDGVRQLGSEAIVHGSGHLDHEGARVTVL